MKSVFGSEPLATAYTERVRASSLDYGAVLRSIGFPVRAAVLGAALLGAFTELYERRHEGCALYRFEQSGATYLFDLASTVEVPWEDRTVAAWAVTPTAVTHRDRAYQRGFPMTPGTGAPVDRGHVIPHLSGGEFGPNIFRQDRALNRGWSEEGKRYRTLEREAASAPGTFYFGDLH